MLSRHFTRESLCRGSVPLSGEQQSAALMALNSPISLILGGAGSGKTTLISAIARTYGCFSHTGEKAVLLLSGHRRVSWDTEDPPRDLDLAYALTVHKSQRSQYDTIFLPVSTATSRMLYRNLLYTAISRAKREVCLVGSQSHHRPPRDRREYPPPAAGKGVQHFRFAAISEAGEPAGRVLLAEGKKSSERGDNIQ